MLKIAPVAAEDLDRLAGRKAAGVAGVLRARRLFRLPPGRQALQRQGDQDAYKPQRRPDPHPGRVAVLGGDPSHRLGRDRKKEGAGPPAEPVIDPGVAVGEADDPGVQKPRHLHHEDGEKEHQRHRQHRREEAAGQQYHRRQRADGQRDIDLFVGDEVVADVAGDRLGDKREDTCRRHHPGGGCRWVTVAGQHIDDEAGVCAI